MRGVLANVVVSILLGNLTVAAVQLPPDRE